MKRSSVVWSLLLAAGIAASGWQWLQRGSGDYDDDHGHTNRKPDLLLPEGLAGLQAVEIHEGERIARFERNPEGRWFHHRHVAAGLDVSLANAHRHGSGGADHPHDADAAAAEHIQAALATFSRTRIERWIERPDPAALAEYGLVKPRLLALMFGPGAQPVLRLQVGDPVPDGLGRYARWPERDAVVILPGYQIDNLAALAALADR